MGALLVVLGSLFPLYGVNTVVRYGPDGPPGGLRGTTALTAWEVVIDPEPRGGSVDGLPTFGYGLVAAAVLAGLGAVLLVRSPLLAAIGGFGVLAGFGMVVGTLWAALEATRLLFGGPPGGSTDEFVGSGTWLIGGAAAVVLVGAVLAQDWPARVPRPTGTSVYQVDDDDTPPFGIALPVSELDVPPAGPETPGVSEPSDDDRGHPTGVIRPLWSGDGTDQPGPARRVGRRPRAR